MAVICPPDSEVARQATKAGASVVGEESIFDAVKEGRIEFDRCLCHVDSQSKLAKSGIARILGPRQLMPSEKMDTIVKDITGAMRNMIGATEYREKLGVIRLAVGQLRYTPEELQANIKVFMSKLKDDVADISEKVSKEIHEVVSTIRGRFCVKCLQLIQVLSSTNAPGFPLSGEFRSLKSIPTKDLTVL